MLVGSLGGSTVQSAVFLTAKRNFDFSSDNVSSAQASTSPVILDLNAGQSSKSEAYYMGQYSKMNTAMGSLGDSQRLELLGIIINAGQMLKKTGSFDAESMADAASYSLKDSLKRQGVDLKDALKGMLFVFQGNRQSASAVSDYSSSLR